MQPVALRHLAAEACVAFILLLLLRLPLYNYTEATGDIAEFLNNAFRVSHGDLPYVDFWLMLPPGEVYLPALVLTLFNGSVNAVLMMVAISHALLGTAAYVMARLLLPGRLWAILLASIIFTHQFLAAIQGYHNIFMLCALAAGGCVVVATARDLRWPLFLAGLTLGVGFLFRFWLTGIVTVALAVSILTYALLKARSIQPAASSLLIYSSGVAAVILPTILLSLPFLSPMVNALLDSLRHGRSFDLPYFCSATSRFESLLAAYNSPTGPAYADMLRDVCYGAATGAVYLLPLVPLVLMMMLLTRRLQPIENWRLAIVIGLTVWAVAALPYALHCSEVSHVHPSAMPSLIIMAMLLSRSSSTNERSHPIRFLRDSGFAIVLLLALAIPVYLRLWIMKGIPQEGHAVTAANGTLAVPAPEEAAIFRDTLTFIETHTSADDPIFVTTWEAPPLYALTGRHNPTYYDSLIDIWLEDAPESEHLLCQQLDDDPPKVIITSSLRFWGQTLDEACPVLAQHIDEKFEVVGSSGYLHFHLQNPSRAEDRTTDGGEQAAAVPGG